MVGGATPAATLRSGWRLPHKLDVVVSRCLADKFNIVGIIGHVSILRGLVISQNLYNLARDGTRRYWPFCLQLCEIDESCAV